MNLLLHLISTILLYVALERMTGDRWPAAFVALAFGIHPLHVESVAWISERKDVLSGLFMMMTLLAYSAYARSGKRGDYLKAIGWFVLGLLSKPMLVTIPFVLLVLDYWPLGRLFPHRRGRRDAGTAAVPLRKLLVEKVPFLLLAACSSAVTYIAQEGGGAMSEIGPLPFADRAGNAVISYLAYVVKAVVPSDLACFYPHRLESIAASEIGVSLVILGLVTAWVWKLRNSHPFLVTGWLLYLGMLVPVIGLVQVGLQAMADRYMYLPIIGLGVMTAWGIPAAVRSRGVVLVAVFALTAAAMGALTWRQTTVWRDSESLYVHALAVTEGNHIAHTNLGVTLADSGRDAEAIPHFREALRLWPKNYKNLSNLARSLGAVGEFDAALRIYRTILANGPRAPLLYLRVGDVFTGLGEPDSALAYYRMAVGLDSTMVEAHLGMADIFSGRSEFGPARESVERVFRLEPGSAKGHQMLGIVAGRENRIAESEEEFLKAIAADSMNAQGYIDLAILMGKTGREAESRALYEKAVRVNPRDMNAHLNLGQSYAVAGDLAGAEREWVRCVELLPPAIEARMNLARLYTIQGKGDRAAAHYTAVLKAAPSRADAHYLLGKILAAGRDRAGAAQHFREALRLEPEFAEAAAALRQVEPAPR